MKLLGWVGLAPILLCAVASSVGCGSDKSQPCQGYERCYCYGNDTCNAGLVCSSGLCVNPAGQGGASSSGGATSAGGSAGSIAAGGSGGGSGAEGGSGGSTSAGGTGGSDASGGTVGSGGSAGGINSGNLIINGDFSQGNEYWEVTWQDGQYATQSYAGGEYCIGNPSTAYYLSFSLGFPPTPSDAFTVEAGATYTLSYRARGYGTLEVKIGQAVSPYAEVQSFTTSVSSAGYQTFTHTVTPATTETQAGLVFNGTLYYLDEVCFDDVSLVRN